MADCSDLQRATCKEEKGTCVCVSMAIYTHLHICVNVCMYVCVCIHMLMYTQFFMVLLKRMGGSILLRPDSCKKQGQILIRILARAHTQEVSNSGLWPR